MPSSGRPHSAAIIRNKQDIAVLIKLPPTADEVHDKWRRQYHAKCPYDSPPKPITSKDAAPSTSSHYASESRVPLDVSSTHLKGIRLPLAAPRPSSASAVRKPLQPITAIPSELLPVPIEDNQEAMAELQIRAALIQACRSTSADKPEKAKPSRQHIRPGSALETAEAQPVAAKVSPQTPISVTVTPIHKLLLERQLFSTPTDASIVTPAALTSVASSSSTPIASRLSSYGQSSFRARHSTIVKPSSPASRSTIVNKSQPPAVSGVSAAVTETPATTEQSSQSPPLEVGTAVEVRYKGKGSWRPGKVLRMKSCDSDDSGGHSVVVYDIEYDEIKRGIERDVPREMIRVSQLDVSNLKNRMLTPGRVSVMSKYSCDSFDLSADSPADADNAPEDAPKPPPKFPAARFLMMGLKDARARLKKTETEVKGDVVADMHKEKLIEMHQQKEKQEQARLWEDIEYEIQRTELNIKASDITVLEVLGRGKFASVYRGQLSVAISDGNADNATIKGTQMCIDAAIKFTEFASAPPVSDLHSEIDVNKSENNKPSSSMLMEVMREVKALKQLRHQNIVMLHGVLLVPRVALVLEYCSGGDLAALLLRHKRKEEYVSFHMKVQILWDAAKGVQFMHSKRYIHRDIKSHNIMLCLGAGGYAAKLGDFGTSRYIPNGVELGDTVGTSGYTAPEVAIPGKYSFPADIFSFGVLMWETMAIEGVNPLAGLDITEAANKMLEQYVRPSLNVCEPPELNDLISRCWCNNAEQRITGEAVAAELSSMLTTTLNPSQLRSGCVICAMLAQAPTLTDKKHN